jgi:diguanylate cyclase (GGDEF)-like protein
LACLFLGAQASIRPLPYVLVPLLIAPLAGTLVALWVIRGLLVPMNWVFSSLRGYIHGRRVPELPVGFSDEAGRLMSEVQAAVEDLDATIHSLEALSGTDHLTGLLNRRTAEQRLTEDLARAKRCSGELVVAMVDIDGFKSINDTHGHQAGDVCIKQVAEVMRRNTREGDWLARWGGDEFVLVLWDASVFASAEMVLGRINADLKRSPIRLAQGGELLLSVSVGGCRYSGEDDIRELLSQADAAMYEAKREGRAWVLAR